MVKKNLPAMQKTQVQSLGWEDPLEKGMATHNRYSCLEKSTDREAWQATIYWVTKSPTGLSNWTDWRSEDHQLNEHEFEQASSWVNDGQGCLASCSPWGCRVGHDLVTEQQPQWERKVSGTSPVVMQVQILIFCLSWMDMLPIWCHNTQTHSY